MGPSVVLFFLNLIHIKDLVRILNISFYLVFILSLIYGGPGFGSDSFCSRATKKIIGQILFQDGTPLQAKQIVTSDGKKWVYGSPLALENVTDDVFVANELLKKLSPISNETLTIASSATGSVTRTGLLKGFGDVDLEQLWVYHTSAGQKVSLTDPWSKEFGYLTSVFKQNILNIVLTHPEFRFVELKAGLWTDPQDLITKGIKWNFDELKAGRKQVIESSGPREVTLEQALAEPGRVKVDWAVPLERSGKKLPAYQEVTLLYRFGVQQGQNTVRLRSFSQGQKEALPFRHSSISFEKEEARLELEASSAESGMSLEEIRKDMLSFSDEDLIHNRFKFLKRLNSMLKFWPDFDSYLRLSQKDVSFSKIESQMIKIITDPQIKKAQELKTQAKEYEVLLEHNIAGIESNLDQWLNEFFKRKAHINFEGKSKPQLLKLAITELETQIDNRMANLLNKMPELDHYIIFKKGQRTHLQSPLIQTGFDIDFRPSEQWIDQYRLKVKIWSEKYPNLDFINPDLVKLTWSSLGRLTPEAKNEIIDLHKKILDPLTKNQRMPLGHGGIQLTPDGGGLVIRYVLPPFAQNRLEDFWHKSVYLGAKPNKNLNPGYLSVHFAQSRPFSMSARSELSQFLSEVDLSELGLLYPKAIEITSSIGH